MSDLPNLLIETNEVLKNIIESKNKGDMDIEAVLSLIEVILESVIPVTQEDYQNRKKFCYLDVDPFLETCLIFYS